MGLGFRDFRAEEVEFRVQFLDSRPQLAPSIQLSASVPGTEIAWALRSGVPSESQRRAAVKFPYAPKP